MARPGARRALQVLQSKSEGIDAAGKGPRLGGARSSQRHQRNYMASRHTMAEEAALLRVRSISSCIDHPPCARRGSAVPPPMFVRSSSLDRPNDAARWRKTTESRSTGSPIRGACSSTLKHRPISRDAPPQGCAPVESQPVMRLVECFTPLGNAFSTRIFCG